MQDYKAARIARGLSQYQLAKDVGVSPRFISQIEQGKAKIPQARRKKFAEALGITIPVDTVLTIKAKKGDNGFWLVFAVGSPGSVVAGTKSEAIGDLIVNYGAELGIVIEEE